MAPLPPPVSPTIQAIYRAYEEDAGDGWRRHLGASLIGHRCERFLWLTFRWASRVRHTGRLLRLFERGHLEEERLVENLRRIGVQVHHYDIETGQQFTVSACNGHFGGSMDAVVLGLPEAPKTMHLAEFKTFNAKGFAELKKLGVAQARPVHLRQMLVYMHLGHLTRAVYIGVCKDTDELYLERIKADPAAAIRLLEKAERIIHAPRPPAGISTDSAWWECRLCPHHATCHEQADVPRNCRTCLHSSPVENGRWSCALAEEPIPDEVQRRGCPEHRYVPDLVAGEQMDVDGGAIVYRMRDGAAWRDAGP